MSVQGPTHKFHRWLTEAARFESDWRKGNNTYFDYYDGVQWTPEEEAEIEDRGQQATVLNIIRPTIDTILALEHQQYADYQVVGMDVSDDAIADMLTILLKQVYEQNDFPFYLNDVFRDGIIGGRGAIEVCVEDGDDDKEHVVVKQLPWEDVFVDPYHRKPDASDARFIFKRTWVDRDILEEMYPEIDIEDINEIATPYDDFIGIEEHAQDSAPDRSIDYYDTKSDRIALFECYYRDVKGKVRYVVFSGDTFFEGSEEGTIEDDETGEKKDTNKSPYDHNKFPIITAYAFRTRKGEPKGLVSHIKDGQDQLNKLNSKYLWNMSANRLIAEEGALIDPDEAREEYNRPDGMILLENGGIGRIHLDDNLRESSYLSNHMNFIIGMIQRISGVNDALLGFGGTNERSATQQQNRIAQGASVQTKLLENLRYSNKQIARVVLLTIGETYTDERIIRVTQPDGKTNYYGINTDVPVIDEQGQPQMDENGDIIKIRQEIGDILRYDVSFKQVMPFNSERQLMLQYFSELAKTGLFPPEWTAEVMLELSDIPGKSDLINRLNQHLANARQQAQAAAAAQAGMTV
jgi:hypothetical protein